MRKVLVAYTTKSGSTGEVAQAIGEELQRNGVLVDVRLIREVRDVLAYDAVIVGGPMIMGWHREAVQFLVENQQTLSQKPVACFLTAMSMTRTDEEELGATTIFQDPALAKPPKNPGKLSFREKYATASNYLAPVLKRAPAIKPVSAGFFAGKLDYGRLNPLDWLFVRLIIGAAGGDFRNWDAIRAWVRGVIPLLGVSE